ncbi:hypothetical protein, partial [Steroidobacter sp.]|uniref:hypothetical protein n=1 Tax=Steroidobacter sp. TaxID=1978227 RepID=UPI001A5DFB6A
MCTPLFTTFALAKPPLPPNAHATWPSVGEAQISDDGRFATYAIVEGARPSKLMVVSTDARWKLELPAAASSRFACERVNDCGVLVFQKTDGGLGLVALGTQSVELLGSIDAYKLSENSGRWLAYLLKGPERELRIRDLSTRRELR